MKDFLVKTAFFLLVPIMGMILCSLLIPIDKLAYRPWEALRYSEIQDEYPFYPNSSVCMNSVGDLCHHTENAIMKREVWKTDELGFRNDKYIKNPDILIIGDSFIAGTSLTQANTLCNQITSCGSGLKIYNIAPSSMSEFDKLLKLGKLDKPKLIVFSTVERSIPQSIQYYSPKSKLKKMKNILTDTPFGVYIDKIAKNTLLNWIKARVLSQKGSGIKSANHSKMFFLQGTKQKHKKNDLAATAATLLSYKQYCDSIGVKFLFLPMPNKETVYHELVPIIEQPNYLLQLDSLLKTKGVATINSLKIYNEYRKTNSALLYHLDDSHWNSRAIKIIAKEIIKQIAIQREAFMK